MTGITAIMLGDPGFGSAFAARLCMAYGSCKQGVCEVGRRSIPLDHGGAGDSRAETHHRDSTIV